MVVYLVKIYRKGYNHLGPVDILVYANRERAEEDTALYPVDSYDVVIEAKEVVE